MNEQLFTDVAIVGGGPTGLALACALGTDGVDVVVIDRAAPDLATSRESDPRVTAISLGSARFLRSIGAFAAMEAGGQPILRIAVQEAHSPFQVTYDHRDVGSEPMGWIVENALIREALMARVAALETAKLWMPAAYAGLSSDADGVSLDLVDGRRVRSRLLVAADGKFSKLRERLGISASHKPYGQTGIVATLTHSEPHAGLATEHFFPDGPFAVLPMTGERSSIVWALEDTLARAVMRLPPQAFVEEVDERVGARLGHIDLASPVRSFPLVLSQPASLISDRAALVGDAAHGIHPIAGQGWNLALRDAAALAELIADAASVGQDPGDAKLLRRYARWRGLDTATLIAVTDSINGLFANDVTPLRLARNLGFAAVQRLPAAKRLFMRHAMGVMGDLPRRMRAPAA